MAEVEITRKEMNAVSIRRILHSKATWFVNLFTATKGKHFS